MSIWQGVITGRLYLKSISFPSSLQNRRCTVEWAWCVGCNPPFVVCGIRLIGLPALSGRDLISACLPFPLAGRPFHRSSPAHSTLSMHHRQVWVDVSFLLRCQSSRLPPKRRCNSTRGRSFLRPIKFRARKPHTNSPAHRLNRSRKQYLFPNTV